MAKKTTRSSPAPPGITNREVLRELRRYESQNVTFIEEDGSWPLVWQRAQGMHVWDLAGRAYLDLTAAFGVAAAGHAPPSVVRAGQAQMGTLLHAMGDVHPHPQKAALAAKLSALTFERWSSAAAGKPGALATPLTGKTIFCNSGFEAVEAALKTAFLATGKRGVIAFEGGYHGLGYGALNATHRSFFRSPFRAQLAEFALFAPFPADQDGLERVEKALRAACRGKTMGAILVEPIQVRGGINVPPPQFLPLLREIATETGTLLILDEIYTGFGRAGRWFACERSGTIPDLVCLGKALTGGFPLSACVGAASVMDAAWPVSTGEALHTSTFLGHPVGCAMALAQIDLIAAGKLCQASARRGQFLKRRLESLRIPRQLQGTVRGEGLLAGLALTKNNRARSPQPVFPVIKEMLKRGYILLPEGEEGNVISLTPPLIISEAQIAKAVAELESALEAAL